MSATKAATKAAATRRKNAEHKKEVRHRAAVKAWETRRKNVVANGEHSTMCGACREFQLMVATNFVTLCGGPSGAKKVLEEAIKRLPR